MASAMLARLFQQDYQPIPNSAYEVENPSASRRHHVPSNCYNRYRGCSTGRAKWRKLLLRGLLITIGANFVLLLLTPIFNPSYSKRPAHFSGRNVRNETVFIAANIIDEGLIRGAWGRSVRGLVELIGPENVFLSIYENDSGPGVKSALKEFAADINCRSAVVSGHIDKSKLPTVQILPHDARVKRIRYLADVRNNAIEPITNFELLHSTTAPFSTPLTKFDKLLFLNDIVFSPRDAADLLFSTNMQADGRTRYNAACAMDFIDPIKFYDRLALRDNEYFESGLPIYPWFVRTGQRAESWHDVVNQKDAVRVKSCWGGMIAFEARWFTESLGKDLTPLQFRSEPDTFWDASECCLVNADLEYLVQKVDGTPVETFVNPYIRVAYNEKTFKWLEFTRRFERLGLLLQMGISWLSGMPRISARIGDVTGEKVIRQEWVYTEPTNQEGRDIDNQDYTLEDIPKFGSWQKEERTVTPGGYCGFPGLLALKNHYNENERPWESIRSVAAAE
ncbi:hypothetical protein H072_7364 [Dactylellina haptotyla CBS 200.50]|uniref:Glycosyltransferase family 69 protein n=1 Tax=Dactylellina haptotyla (strain CBS 200.50) TaxID=1284197 RepID=S8A7C9_DACHA|nr:hypothetical protein H072_7364 [Dactylellina haptotyla CBS 200.50]